MANVGSQVAMPSGAPSAWGSGVTTNGSRDYQAFTGTTAAASNKLQPGKWYTLLNDGATTQYVRFVDGSGSGSAAATDIALAAGARLDFVVVETQSDKVYAFATGAGSLKLWCSDLST